ncbi:MAG TPA: hypothetical protein VGL70_07420 [Candidatus Binatia bacterium]|jgi:hypothetical protein
MKVRSLKLFVLSLLLIAGCSTTTGRPGLRGPINPAKVTAPQHCPDRIDRAKAGGAVGNVVGFVAASALGSPLMGILYSASGYAAGFGSADRCKKETATLATVKPQTANGSGTSPTGKIAEENLK